MDEKYKILILIMSNFYDKLYYSEYKLIIRLIIIDVIFHEFSE